MVHVWHASYSAEGMERGKELDLLDTALVLLSNNGMHNIGDP